MARGPQGPWGQASGAVGGPGVIFLTLSADLVYFITILLVRCAVQRSDLTRIAQGLNRGRRISFSPRQRSGYGLVKTLHLRLSTAPMPMAAGGGVLREGGASDSM